jgi:L-lactate dehydrogenase
MTRRVAIIGTGWVGSSVAISTLHSGVADELLLHDAREAVAEGEAMDLAHGASFYPSAMVRTATIDEMADADVVVIAAGRGGRAGESRLALLRENAALIADIGARLARARGITVVVSNPVPKSAPTNADVCTIQQTSCARLRRQPAPPSTYKTLAAAAARAWTTVPTG